MWYENNILIAIISFTTMAVLLLILSAISTFNLSAGAEKIIEMIITGISAFVTGYITKSIKDAVTTKSTTTTEQSSNVPEITKGEINVPAPKK